VSMFSEYCAVPFEIEPVEVIDSFGESHGEQTAAAADSSSSSGLQGQIHVGHTLALPE
jgi:hypothetical protein